MNTSAFNTKSLTCNIQTKSKLSIVFLYKVAHTGGKIHILSWSHLVFSISFLVISESRPVITIISIQPILTVQKFCSYSFISSIMYPCRGVQVSKARFHQHI